MTMVLFSVDLMLWSISSMDTTAAVDFHIDTVGRRTFITQEEQHTVHNIIDFCGKENTVSVLHK